MANRSATKRKGAASAAGQPDAQSAGKSEVKRKRRGVLLPVLLILVGLGVLLYPVVATQWNNMGQLKAAEEYSKLEKDIPQEVKDTAWEEAHVYNDTKNTGPIMDAWSSRAATDNPEYQRYEQQLNQANAMGRIIIPSINSDLPIYHGTSDAVLQRGVGHLFGTDLPVGGIGKHSVLSGHTGLSNATLWDNLVKVKEGDAFYIAVAGHKLKYEVHSIRVVTPDQTEVLEPVEGEDLVTLVTCTPYGINTHRLIVRGHQVPMDPSDEQFFDDSGLNWQWWMWAILAATILILALLFWWVRRMMRGGKPSETTKETPDDAGNGAAESANEGVAAGDDAGMNSGGTAVTDADQNEAPPVVSDDQPARGTTPPNEPPRNPGSNGRGTNRSAWDDWR